MRSLIIALILLCSFGSSAAQPAKFYKSASRVTWLVEDIDKVLPAWVALGLKDIEKYPNMAEPAVYQGKATTIYAWQITGRLGDLTVDMIQPAEGQLNAYTHFLAEHGDGIFSIVHEVPTQADLQHEIKRMKSKGVGVLQRVSLPKKSETAVYFDTEKEGKFSLGLVLSKKAKKPAEARMVSHFGFDVLDLPSVSRYWERLGFPPLQIERASQLESSRYLDQPLSLEYFVGYETYNQYPYEWIAAPPTPTNLYADYLKALRHREGIQHIGVAVADLEEAVTQYKRQGYHVQQSGAWSKVGSLTSNVYAFMDTERYGGVSVELMQAK